MCLIVHRPADKPKAHIPNGIIDSNLKINGDGFGIAWREDNELFYNKFGPEGAKEFKELLKKVDKGKSEYVAHFRMRTHGPKNDSMAHPFLYSDRKEGDILIFHNGVIPISTPEDKSDTAVFVEHVLAKMPPRWWMNDALLWLIEEAIGYSRIAIMTLTDTIRLTGGQKWVEQGGLFYSTQPYGSSSYVSKSRPPNDAWGMPPANLKNVTPPKGKEVAEETDTKTLELDTDEAIVLPTEASKGKTVTGRWMHAGHNVDPVDEPEFKMNEAVGSAWCQECDTLGEYYIIGGKVYIDIGHVFTDEEDEDESFDTNMALLPAGGILH